MSIRNMMIGGAGASPPGAPTNVVATVGVTSQTASVAFDAPASNGGSAITSFTVTSSPGGVTASGGSSPISVGGLTNGTSYTFTVTATNAIGTSPASSASSAVTVIDPPLFTFTNATFTSGGQTGRDGPSNATARSGMTGTPTPSNYNTNTSYFNTSSGIQLFTIPKTGTYELEAIGASGGFAPNNSNGPGGWGARIVTRINLTKSDVLGIVVGQPGINEGGGGANAGGGGGSFIYNYSDNTLYVAAGGGGGFGTSSGQTRTASTNASLTNDGNAGASDPAANGGGSSGGTSGQRGSFSTYADSAGPGAGWTTGGNQARPNSPCSYPEQPQAGAGRSGGFRGGAGHNNNPSTLHGGFGGGGGGSGACNESGSGGGGGYSGGGVGSTCCYAKGGGGGSYYVGTLQTADIPAVAAGQVVVTFIS